MESAIFRVALLLGFGHTTLNSAALEITASGNNGVGFTQGSEAILTCTINPYTGSQIWKVDGVSIADCGFVLCSENASNPARYSFTPDISTGTFVFTINPVDSADNGNIDCFNGSNTETFIMVVTDPVVTTDTDGKLNGKRCTFFTCGIILLFFGIGQSTFLGCIIYGICKKEGITSVDNRCGVFIAIAFSSVPVIGLILLLLLRCSGYWKGGSIFMTIKDLCLNWKYWSKDIHKILLLGATVFLIIVFTVASIILSVFECWGTVSQKSSELVSIIIIMVVYYFDIWLAVFFELICLQYFVASKIEDLYAKGKKFVCMSCQLVDVCTTCKMVLCEGSINKHEGLSHTRWNSMREAPTCKRCEKKAVTSAKCVCLTCKRLVCEEHYSKHYSNRLCQYTPLWSKRNQVKWKCDICFDEDDMSAENICLECKIAFCRNCSCQCLQRHRTKKKLTKVTSKQTCKAHTDKEVNCEQHKCQEDCKIEFCEHMYPDVCLACKKVICRNCTYLHVMWCKEPELIWRNPQQALYCSERNHTDKEADTFCLDCNAPLCGKCSAMHLTRCDHKAHKDVKCNACGKMEAVCQGCRSVCKGCSYDDCINRNEMFCTKCLPHTNRDCYECKKATSTEADYFCTHCGTFICNSCSQSSCNSHLDKVLNNIQNRNTIYQSCECPVHGYCTTCGRTVCRTCYERCNRKGHTLKKDETIPLCHIPLIAFVCLPIVGMIPHLIANWTVWKK